MHFFLHRTDSRNCLFCVSSCDSSKYFKVTAPESKQHTGRVRERESQSREEANEFSNLSNQYLVDNCLFVCLFVRSFVCAILLLLFTFDSIERVRTIGKVTDNCCSRIVRSGKNFFRRLFMHAIRSKENLVGTQSLRLCPVHGRKLSS